MTVEARINEGVWVWEKSTDYTVFLGYNIDGYSVRTELPFALKKILFY